MITCSTGDRVKYWQNINTPSLFGESPPALGAAPHLPALARHAGDVVAGDLVEGVPLAAVRAADQRVTGVVQLLQEANSIVYLLIAISIEPQKSSMP